MIDVWKLSISVLYVEAGIIETRTRVVVIFCLHPEFPFNVRTLLFNKTQRFSRKTFESRLVDMLTRRTQA